MSSQAVQKSNIKKMFGAKICSLEKLTCSLLVYVDVRIGFAKPLYTFNEPDLDNTVTDVVIVREGDRLSEQTFLVTIFAGNVIDMPPATLEADNEDKADYSLTSPANFITLNFPPSQQNITLALFLYHDKLSEGTEAFQITSIPEPNFPNFGPPSMGGAFSNAEILITDVCKLTCKCSTGTYMLNPDLCWR